MKRTKQIISIGIALAFSVTTLKSDKVMAIPTTGSACKDVPSCVVTGTVVIGGVLYYIIKNTATGMIRRMPAKRTALPSHRTHQGDYSLPGSRIEKQGFVFSEEECEKFAREQERKYGGKWTAITNRIPMNTPEGDMSTSPGYICAAERES